MSRRRVVLYTPAEVRMWANSSTMGILNSLNGRRLFKSFLSRNYGDAHLDVITYLRCFELCGELRNSQEQYQHRLNELLDTVPHLRWERRIQLTIDMFEGPRLRAEINFILRELQDELWQLIEREPEYVSFREDLQNMAKQNEF